MSENKGDPARQSGKASWQLLEGSMESPEQHGSHAPEGSLGKEAEPRQAAHGLHSTNLFQDLRKLGSPVPPAPHAALGV